MTDLAAAARAALDRVRDRAGVLSRQPIDRSAADWAADLAGLADAIATARAALGSGAAPEAEALDAFQAAVGRWAEATFRQATADPVIAHLEDEVAELRASGDPEEAADCAILLLDFAHKQGFSLMAEMRRKFALCQIREYAPPDERGVIRHRPAGDRASAGPPGKTGSGTG